MDLATVATNGVLIDTGPLVAVLSKDDQHHAACVNAAKNLRGPFYIIWPAVTEAAYLLREDPTAVDKLLGRIRSYKLRLLGLTADDTGGISRILNEYHDQHFDLTDAALMHVAHREGIEKVFTVDQRHFSVYRTPKGTSLIVLPAEAT